MPSGIVTSFDAARGSGRLQLEDDGGVVKFDVSIANTSKIAVGDKAEVFTGLSLAGKLIAKVVLFDVDEAQGQPFPEGVQRLQRLGFLSGWSPDAVRDAPDVLTRAGAGSLLLASYTLSKGQALPIACRIDRAVCLDEHFGDSLHLPVAELVAIAPPGLAERMSACADDLSPPSLGALLAAFNAGLQAVGVSERYVMVDLDSDRYVMVAVRDQDFATAVRSTVLRASS